MSKDASRTELASYLDELAVYGHAVERGVVPLSYAVEVLRAHRLQAGAEEIARDLRHWEDRIVAGEFHPELIDEERWERPTDEWLREHLRRALQNRGMPVDEKTGTGELLREYLRHLMDGDGHGDLS
ncbi:hypothetical protein ACWD3I_48165 [Streptomyces sp. NPDC002817]|uniref:hypothetical protein n=1 Tax=Streptomyces sp. NPDC088357 TaxID=3154655 RepID=UPI00341AE7AE